MMPEFPEHDKLKQIKEESRAIGEFIEWLEENGYSICEYDDANFDNYYRTPKSTEQLLAMHFNIDLNKIEQEKRAMLEKLRHD